MGDNARKRGAIVALVVAVAVVVHSRTDDDVLSSVCYLGVLIGASLGAWAGAQQAPRGQRLVPRMLAAGIALTALGDTLWEVLDAVGAGTDVSVADAPWFLSYMVLCAALWVVLRRARAVSRRDLNFPIDALTIVVVSVIILWSFSINSIVADYSVSPFVRSVWAAYPVADAVLLALVARILMSPSARSSIDGLFAVGAFLWLAADIAYLVAPDVGALPMLMDAAWMIAPVLMARATWRVREITPEPAGSKASTSAGWAVTLAIAVAPLLVPPALEVIADLRGEPDQPLRLFVGMTALIALASIRTGRLLHSEERAHREADLARDAALEASRAKSMFLANVSHEIRTPLTTVLATAEILEDTQLDEVQLELLSKMNRQGTLLRDLVEEILDFSRIEAGELRLAATVFDLHAMLSDAADVYLPRAMERGIGLDWRVDADVPHEVIGDSGRLFQVLTNLLDNALKFTDQGQVTFGARLVPETSGAHVIEFVVADTGIGIAPEDQDAVFDSFRQVDGTTTRRHGGTGLGLAISRQLAHLMGGTIDLTSQPGSGSTFVFRVPLLRPAPSTPDATTAVTPETHVLQV